MKRTKMLLSALAILLAGVAVWGQRPAQQRPDWSRFHPAYHYFPSGDPTGLFYHDGKYYNAWGGKYGTDFINWTSTEGAKALAEIRKQMQDPNLTQEQRTALRKKMSRNLGGSGSIVVDTKNVAGFGENAWLAYYHNEQQPFRTQIIGLSYSTDQGRTWIRSEQYPVLNINSREFRDPKIFWHEPTQKWIMAIGWAEAPKIKFFRSENLKDWEFMSDFGPWGATNGVWECADFFPLAVDGDPNNVKWVIAISVQPYTGQYFVGDFDGTRFVLDPEFAAELTYDDVPKGTVLFDFERGIDTWTLEGNAFYESPTNVQLYRQGAIMGRVGQYFVDSYHNEARGTGSMTSPEFFITKNFINFKIGGVYAPGEEGIGLLVDGKMVRTETGRNASSMQWSGWDVSEYRGKKAQIVIFDKRTNGEIYVDHIMLCDEIRTMEPEKAFWFDYGQDFFAVRSWASYAPDEDRVIWTSWMGSWRYNSLEPMRGIQSVPREVKLKTFPEGIRLVQSPIDELKTLRGKKSEFEGATFEGIWKPKKLAPAENVYELIVEFENIDAQEFGVKLCVGEGQKTTIGYNVVDEELFYDRRDSGLDDFIDFFPAVFKGPLKNRTNTVKLHIFVDRCSVEVFANDGETCISNKIYPDAASTGIEFYSSYGKTKIKSIEFYPMNPIVQD